MFHNMQKKAASEGNAQDTKPATENTAAATEQTTEVNESIKENNTNNQKKEMQPMNSPQTKDNQDTNNENRVDIPGNNFNRPGQPAGSRPSYPGSYPGAAAAASTPSYAAQPANEMDSRKLVIGQGISLSGEIEACDYLIVEGTVEAALKGANNMDISETGAFYGTVEIESATIAGRFEGDITVNGRLTVQSTGTIIGSISYKELEIEAGATIEGSVTPFDSQASTRTQKKTKSKGKVSQDNSAELPFSDKVAS